MQTLVFRRKCAAHFIRSTAIAAVVLLAGCGDQHPVSPGERVVFQTVEKPVPMPCPVKKPTRPAKLARPLPTDPAALAELLIAKLLEWDGAGGYGDQADAALDTCLQPKAPLQPKPAP